MIEESMFAVSCGYMVSGVRISTGTAVTIAHHPSVPVCCFEILSQKLSLLRGLFETPTPTGNASIHFSGLSRMVWE